MDDEPRRKLVRWCAPDCLDRLDRVDEQPRGTLIRWCGPVNMVDGSAVDDRGHPQVSLVNILLVK